MRGEILSISVVSRPSGDPYLTISRVSMILSKMDKMVLSPRPYRSGLVVRPPAWDPKGARDARFESWCVLFSKCFWGGAKASSAGKIDLPQNSRGPRILMFFFYVFLYFLPVEY